MIKKLMRTDDDTASLVLRVLLGVVFFPHGAQKLLGWYGGHGFSGTVGFFTGQLGIPWILAVLVVITEFFGALALISGLLTRLAAAGIASIMVVATFMLHWQHGFFMNWMGNLKGEGFEYHILALAICVSLIIKGGGRWSLDGLLAADRG